MEEVAGDGVVGDEDAEFVEGADVAHAGDSYFATVAKDYGVFGTFDHFGADGGFFYVVVGEDEVFGDSASADDGLVGVEEAEVVVGDWAGEGLFAVADLAA